MNTNLENTKAQMRKGVLELCILAIIAEKEAYPSDILEKLKSSELIVVEGTLYPLLTRLKDAGLLEYRWVESEKGPPRKYYQLTQNGNEALQELHKGWVELVKCVEMVTKSSIHEQSTLNNEQLLVDNELLTINYEPMRIQNDLLSEPNEQHIAES
jgi:PadR family transcriptional regulator, regulatory protein PadR